MDAVRVGIIGAGKMGRTHADNYAQIPGVDVVGVFDIDRTAAENLAKRSGARAFDSLEGLLGESGAQAVSICTPDARHREPAVKAADANLHILLEKPIATTVPDARDILDAAAQGNVTLGIGFVSRYVRRYAQAHEGVTSGKIGRVATITVKRFNRRSVAAPYAERDDVVDFLAVHDIDLLRWFGGEIASVYAEADTFVFEGSGHADTVMMQVRFRSGAMGQLHVGWAIPDSVPYPATSTVEVVGTDGVVSFDGFSDQLMVATPAGITYPGAWDLADGFRCQLTAFVETVRGGARLLATGVDGLRALQVIQAAKESFRSRRAVDVERS